MNRERRYSAHAGGKSLPSWAVLLISVLLAMLSILIVYFTFFAKQIFTILRQSSKKTFSPFYKKKG